MGLLLDAIEDLKYQGLTAPRVIHTFFSRRVVPLKMRGHPQWEFQGTMDSTIESSVLIHLEEVDDLMMITIGVSTQDHGDGESPDAFHIGNPPPTDGPLISMVSNLPLVLPSKVDHHHTLFMLFIYI